MYKYSVSKPDLSGNEKKYVNEALDSGWISSQGPMVKKLEEEFAKYIGTKYAVAVSSGTSAIHLSLVALGIGQGDEVIVPDFTMIASAWPVSYVGATPVFVDCEWDLNISVERIREKITPKTKAIIVTHIYGRPAEMQEILNIAYEYNLKIIEDACEAHGATIGGKKVGSFGDLGCFSLFANKIISSGEGGLITTDSEFLYKQLQHLKAMAFDPGHTFLHPKMGFNFRMTNLQAAVAVAQLERIDLILAKRKQIQGWYDKKLGEFTLPRPEGSVLWMYDILAGNRDELMALLKEDGIETRMFFKPMTSQPMYRQKAVGYVSSHYSECGLYLPTYTGMTEEDVNFISEKVLKYIKKL